MTPTTRGINGPDYNGRERPQESGGELLGLKNTVRAALVGLMLTGANHTAAQESSTLREEILVADASDSLEGTVARAFADLPMTVEEMQESFERKRVIAEVISDRLYGAEFYDDYVSEFSALSEELQYELALAILPGNGEGGLSYPLWKIELIQNLRLPSSLENAIKEEAAGNGADDWDLGDIDHVIKAIRINGTFSEADLFAYMVEIAPENSYKIAIMSLSQQIVQRNEASEESLAASEESLTASEESLAASEESLAIAKTTRDAGEEAVNASNGN